MRSRLRVLGATVVVSTSVVVAGTTAPVQAAAHRVLAVPRDFATIQAAVDAAAPGDTVNVGPGTYVEQVVIDKDLALHGSGANATVVKAPPTLVPYGQRAYDGAPLAAIVQVGNHAQVHVSGLGVTGPVPCDDVDEGIGVVEDANLDISDSRVSNLVSTGCSGAAYGLVFGVAPGYAINGVPGGTTASGRVSHVTVDTYQSAGIVVVGRYDRPPTQVTLADNTVVAGTPVAPAGQVGIWVRLNAVGTVTGNTVTGGACTYDGCGFDPIWQYQSAGLVAESADGTTFTGNHVSGADVGLIDNAANVTVNGNYLAGNNDFGIAVFDADGSTKNNTISGGRVGIGVVAASRNSTELSSGDHISGVSDSATQTFECCGFHATVTIKG